MNTILERSVLRTIAVSLTAVLPLFVYSQTPPTPPKTSPPPTVRVHPVIPRLAGDDNFERSIAVDPNVKLSLCVVSGDLKINGWRRNEVRVLVKGGSELRFRVREKSADNAMPVWLEATGYDPHQINKAYTDCLWGDEIDIDVPDSASVAIKGQEIDTTIDTLKTVEIKVTGGDITLRNIAHGVMASTYDGDINVEGSKGAMTLGTSSGSIVVFRAGPAQIGDSFAARTNGGIISLQRVEHRQIEATSISGSVYYDGDILRGGTYNLRTNNGSIRVSIPSVSSCLVAASYGFGTFKSEVPLKTLTEDIHDGPIKSITASLGTGANDTTLKLTTNSGNILIRKQ
jgi:hypothetical protein